VRQAFTKENSSCYVFVNVKFNGVLKSAGTAKIRGFDTFSKCKSRGGGYRVSHSSPLKMPCRTCLYRGYICYVKRYVSHRNQWGGRIQNFDVFGLLRDC